MKASNSTATHQNEVPTLPPGGYDNDDDEDDEDDENDEEMADLEPAIYEQSQEEQPTHNLPNSEESSVRPLQTEEPTPTYPDAHGPPGFTPPYLHAASPSQPSPTQSQHSPTYFPPHPMSTTTSPNLYPQQYPSSEHGHDQIDTEATHALLLLADGSRKSSEVTPGVSSEKKGRGMSVKDLLSP